MDSVFHKNVNVIQIRLCRKNLINIDLTKLQVHLTNSSLDSHTMYMPTILVVDQNLSSINSVRHISVISGPSTCDIGIMEKMMAVGMNIAYVNMAFGSREENREIIKMLREAAKNFSITVGKTYPLAIAMRLSGQKIRTGRIIEVSTFGLTIPK